MDLTLGTAAMWDHPSLELKTGERVISDKFGMGKVVRGAADAFAGLLSKAVQSLPSVVEERHDRLFDSHLESIRVVSDKNAKTMFEQLQNECVKRVVCYEHQGSTRSSTDSETLKT